MNIVIARWSFFFVATLTGLGEHPLGAQGLRVSVDRRAEEFAILWRLAGAPEFSSGRLQPYVSEIDTYFRAFRNDSAVRLARDLHDTHGIAYSTVLNLAVHVSDPVRLIERAPLDIHSTSLDPRWHTVDIRRFLAAARQFATAADIDGFFNTHSQLFDSAETRLRRLVDREAHLDWFAQFFGGGPGQDLIVVPLLANSDGNFGPQFQAPGQRTEAYAVLGTGSADSAGYPVFSPRLLPTLVHEFCHSFINDAVYTSRGVLAAAGSRIFASTEAEMRSQAYGDWLVMLDESLVRASVARYLLKYGGPVAASEEIKMQQARGFYWTLELFNLLGEYENHREDFPSFASFMPRVVKYINALAPRVKSVRQTFDAQRPHVAHLSVKSGSTNVDPRIGHIDVRFDRQMRDGYFLNGLGGDADKLPQVIWNDVHFDSAGRVITIPVRLSPDHEYAFTLNGPIGGGFRSRDGFALAMYTVRFRTRRQ